MSILRREEKEMWRQRQRLEPCVDKTGVASSHMKLGGWHGTYCPVESQWGPSHGHVDFGLLGFGLVTESSSGAWSCHIGGNLSQQLQETNTDDNGYVLRRPSNVACCSLVTGNPSLGQPTELPGHIGHGSTLCPRPPWLPFPQENAFCFPWQNMPITSEQHCVDDVCL